MNLSLDGAVVKYYPNFLSKEISSDLFGRLSLLFLEDDYKKVNSYKLNRKTHVFIDSKYFEDKQFIIPKIWGTDVIIEAFSDDLSTVKQSLEKELNYEFNICLANFYETGKNNIGWHSDNEEKGEIECIASISLGTDRTFAFKNKVTGETKRIILEHCSLLVMDKGCQENYLHCLLEDKKCKESRLNLTFRFFKYDSYNQK